MAAMLQSLGMASPASVTISDLSNKVSVNSLPEKQSQMDFLENVYKKSARSVKVGKILLRPIVRMMSQVTAISLRRLANHHNLNPPAFMTCIIEVDSSRVGWQRGVFAVLNNCKGVRFKMDQNGVVEISGIGNPKRLLKKLGRSSRAKLLWFQYGQCSENLYVAYKKSDPPTQESKPIGYYNNTKFPFQHMHLGYHPMQPSFAPYCPY